MFEQRKSITVNGVTFNMILVEGDKFCIGEREYEVDDFYMAEFPVTQELYMAVMRPAHTGSYNMMPDNFDYLNPNRYFLNINFNESIEGRQKRLDKEWQEQRKREEQERKRIEEMSKSLPVNNISWLECIEFIKKLNALTGLNFALPSFEQWYFAASGGIESKGYAFAGSDDANAVGHFHKLSTITKSEGLFVMSDDKSVKNKRRKAANQWFQKTGSYSPNELGLYDMSGLVYEWLDEAGKVIGGAHHSNPDNVCKDKRYGYTDFRLIDSQLYSHFVKLNEYYVGAGNLLGFRLILDRSQKQYAIEQKPHVKSVVPDSERHFIETIYRMPEFGLLRSIIANKYRKEPTIRCQENHSAYSKFDGNVYHIFVCPQNLTMFSGECFSSYLSRRKFITYCKGLFISLLNMLCDAGYNMLIHDKLGMSLTDLSYYSSIHLDLSNLNFKNKKHNFWGELTGKYNLVTNNPDIFEISKLLSYSDKYDYIETCANTVVIEICDTFSVHRAHKIQDEFLSHIEFSPKRKHDSLRLSLSCFCDFNSVENDFIGMEYSDEFQSKGIVSFMKEKISNGLCRINNEDFDNTERVNQLFCKQNKGGLYEYNYPPSSGLYEIQDERFFILPQPVYDEWRQSLKP